MTKRRTRRHPGRGQTRYLWLILEIIVVLAGGIAIALIASSILRPTRAVQTPSPSLTEVTASPSVTAETTTPPGSPTASLTAVASPSATPSAVTAVTATITVLPTLTPGGNVCEEPNNSWDEAIGPVACPGVYECLIWPAGDITDFYFVELTEPTQLTATLTQIPPGVSLNLYIFDANRNLLISSEQPEQVEEYIQIDLEPGRYYIAVKALTGANETQPYRLELGCSPLAPLTASPTVPIASPTTPVATAPPTETVPPSTPASGAACAEPNSSFDTAYGPVACGDAFACDLNPGGGDLADVYFIDIAEPTTLDVLLTDIPEGSDWRLQLYSQDEIVIASSDNEGNADEEIIQEVEPGRYYIAVLVSRTSILPGTYVLRVNCIAPTPAATATSTPTPGPATATPVASPTPIGTPTPTPQGPCAEPNNDFGTAFGSLACGDSISCYLDPPGGDLVDMYFIDLDQETQLTLDLTDMPADVDWDLFLYDINGVLLAFSTGVAGENEEIVYLALSGRYYISVEDLVAGMPPGGYTLTILCGPFPTPTPSFTPPPTDTLTPTTSATPPLTATKTRTPTYTRTFTITRTGTSTRTPTWTKTPTRTTTGTITQTPTRTPTGTPTWTATITPSPTQTPTQAPTSTETATGTATSTGTVTLSPTITLTFTPTGTATNTGTPTNTVLATSTPTGTLAIAMLITDTSGIGLGEVAQPMDGGSPAIKGVVDRFVHQLAPSIDWALSLPRRIRPRASPG